MTHTLAPIHAVPQWVIVQLVPLPDGRTNKVPLSPATALPANAHDPANWLTHTAALALAATLGPAFTTGFVITVTDPFWCLDIDGCAVPGGWSPLALELIAALPGCAVEVSQSGRGLHIWGQGPVPSHASKNTALHIELYSELRFIAAGYPGHPVTGDMTQPCAAIADVVARYFPPVAAASGVALPDAGPRADWRGPTDDAELLRRALRSQSAGSVFGGKASFANLWNADADALARAFPGSSEGAAYDASSADAALAQHLAFWTGCDGARMKELMLQSFLAREKWEARADYLDRTIATACKQQVGVLEDKAGPVSPLSAGPPIEHYTLTKRDPLGIAGAFVKSKHTRDGVAVLRAWQKAFYEWDGASWVPAPEPDLRAQLYAFINRWADDFKPDRAVVSEVIDALAAHAIIPSSLAPPCWVDDPKRGAAADMMMCANGLLHLPTLALHPPTPRLFGFNASPVPYEPDAPPPQAWLKFLRDVWPDDPESVTTLQDLFGYLLTPDTSQHKLFLIVGPKRSGKGTIARVLTELLGQGNVASPTLGSMAGQFGLAPLVGKVAAIISDARMSGRTDQQTVAENLLRISGEDRVDVDRKFLGPLTLKLGVRFLMLTNELPRIADASGAMASRFIVLCTDQTFFGREDLGLTGRLLAELPGILRWAIEGRQRLQVRGHFVPPQSAAGAAQELAELGSPVATFLRECCQVGSGLTVSAEAIYAAWRQWCAEQGIERPQSQPQFSSELHAAMPGSKTTQPRIGGKRKRIYVGLSLLPGVLH